jgi:hypothetical protein
MELEFHWIDDGYTTIALDHPDKVFRQWPTSSLQNEDLAFMSASDDWLVSCNLLRISTSCRLYDDTSDDPKWRTTTRCGTIEEEEMPKSWVSEESLGLRTSTS